MRTGTVILVVAVLVLVCLANSADAAKKQKSSKGLKSSGNAKQEKSAVKSKKTKSSNKYSKSANAKQEKLAEPKAKPAKEQRAAKVKKVKRSVEEAVPEERAEPTETKCDCPPVPECVCEKCAATQAAKDETPDDVVIEEEEFPTCEATVDAGLFCENSCSCKKGTVCFASTVDATHGICKIPEPEDLDLGVYL